MKYFLTSAFMIAALAVTQPSLAKSRFAPNNENNPVERRILEQVKILSQSANKIDALLAEQKKTTAALESLIRVQKALLAEQKKQNQLMREKHSRDKIESRARSLQR